MSFERVILLEQFCSLLEKDSEILEELHAIFEQMAFILALLGNILENRLLIRTNKVILDNLQLF